MLAVAAAVALWFWQAEDPARALGPQPRDREPGNAPIDLPSTPPAGVPLPPAQAPDVGGYKQRGVALGLFAEDVSFSYVPLLNEIAELGATHVALVVPIYQSDATATDFFLHTRFSPTLSTVADAVRAARRNHLEVTLFPIIRLAHAKAGEWRGNLAPSNRKRWFQRYTDILGDLAAVAEQTAATRLVIGSELSSLDGERDLEAWRVVVERIRRVFSGRLMYSSNWDHYRDARLFDLVDEDGVVAYFELRDDKTPATDAALESGWTRLQKELTTWRRDRPEHPFVFTEVGYRSRAGASAHPWDETPGGTVDLEEQRRAFAAFRKVWSDNASLDGVYVWNWYGYGGATSTGYTPRGKPAEAEVRRLLQGL